MEAYFYGDLVKNEELNKIVKQRKKKYQEITIPKTLKDTYIGKGWVLKKEFKYKVRIYKEKQYDELLEDEVWLLFKKMNFLEMNKDRNFKIKAGPIKKQIEVFAKEENNVFIVECTSSVEGILNPRKKIHEISNIKKDIINSVKKNYGVKSIQVSLIIATRGIQWTEDDENLAKKNKIFIWREEELKYYHDLIKHLGNSAKFQLYSIFFQNKKVYQLKNIRIPAICGGRGRAKYYSFII